MEDNYITNTYEEARMQRLQHNRKRFEDLGISKISKSLADLTNSEKMAQQRVSKPKSKDTSMLEPRRSSRARNPVPLYRDDVDIGLPPLRKRSRLNSSSWASYLARPLDEVKTASYEERVRAIKVAEEFQRSKQSGNPSFVKSMVRSHVYSCFWLGLPSKFCEDHLSKSVTDMVLEDENGSEYEAIYIGKRTGLSGGWRAFALDHKLDDGDALVFELIGPTRFKIYIIKASSLDSLPSQEHNVIIEDKGFVAAAKKTRKGAMKLNSQSNLTRSNDSSSLQSLQQVDGEGRLNVNPTKKNEFVPQKLRKKAELVNASKSTKVTSVEDREKCVSLNSRKRAAPTKFLRKKAL